VQAVFCAMRASVIVDSAAENVAITSSARSTARI
jgi:hypothetical protein